MANKRQKTSDAIEIVESVEKELYKKVRAYIAAARAKVYTVANEEMVKAYWNVGREIVEKQGGGGRSVYGDGLVDRLAIKLTAEFGPGYTRVNLFYMRRFYLAFPKVHTLCKQLSWSHYRTLITVENEDARQYYFEEAIKSKWSVRVLQRQHRRVRAAWRRPSEIRHRFVEETGGKTAQRQFRLAEFEELSRLLQGLP